MNAVRVLCWVNAGVAVAATVLFLSDPEPILFGAAAVAAAAAVALWFADRWIP